MSGLGRSVSLILALLFACTTTPGAVHDADAGPVDAGTTRHPLCVDGVSVDGTYPQVEYALELGGTLPDLSFPGLDENGQSVTVAMHDFFEPCAARTRLLILRTSAAWCGTCRWDLTHTAELADSAIGARLRWVDLLVADDDNLPATVADLSSWRQRIDRPQRVAIDPDFSLRALNDHEPLPRMVVVDTRTMEILFSVGNADPDQLATRLRSTLASLDGEPWSEPAAPDKFDGLFDRKQRDLIHDMTKPGAPPADPTNAKADDPAAAALGRALYADTALSPTNTVSCATCHNPTLGFADGKPQSQGVAPGDRNAPSVVLASHARWQFWDGRADSLWAQALGPLENPAEFNSSRLFVAHAVHARYRSEYEGLFGPMPALDDTTRFPPSGRPGDATWQAMQPADQVAVTRVFVNVGKSIAAFERTLRPGTNRLDAYVSGELSALSDMEKRSLSRFLGGGCVQCHYGPRLTDDAFHNVRFPTGRRDGLADRGRIDGVPRLLGSEFLSTGDYSDAPLAGRVLAGLVAAPSTLGAFKTPSLRGVARTAPYGHGGTLATLRDVVTNYSTAALMPPPPGDPIGPAEPWLPRFSSGHIPELLPFLELLDDEPEE